jgi:23S rRNA (pseudouridine1915-N3)-methyltransferase
MKNRMITFIPLGLNWLQASGKIRRPAIRKVVSKTLGMRIKICWVGKTQNAPIKSLVSLYLGRLKHLIPVEIVEVPDLSKRRGLKGTALLIAEGAEIANSLNKDCCKVVLDERGTQFGSIDFARWLEAEQMRGTRELAFIIGGPDGVADGLSERADARLSLGKMTWTHEMVRVLLLEQIYRAMSILRNLPYHKQASGRKQ